jgi:DNA-binding MarR family transcriptional regulator
MQQSEFSPATTGPADPATAEEAVMATMMSLGRRMRQRLPGDRIEFSALPVLKTLRHHGPMRVSTLATELGLDASTVSRHVRHLEDRGLLERAGDPDDGRASRMTVSELGAACLDEGAGARRAMIAEVLSAWTDSEREQLRTLLHRFHTDLTSQENA